MSASLKNKTISGMIWSSLQKFGTMIISFIANIVLARLLTPDDYGCIGMLMIFIALSNTFIDGGFGSALIQKKNPTNEDYSTIFYWNLFLSIVLYIILYFSAPVISNFYNIPLLSSVLRVQGLVLIINALGIIQSNQLRKQLKFKKLATVSLTSALISVIITILLAWQGWGVWSLVAQQLLIAIFNTSLLWILNDWKPLLMFSKKSFKELFNFGGFILLSNLINSFSNNIQGILIGKFFTPATMGLYTQARKLEEVASNSISSVVDQVSYPILAEVQNDKEKLIYTIKKLITSVAFLSFPLMILLIVIAEPLIKLLYSDRWIDAVPYFKILCVAGIAICLQGINYYAVASVGKSKELFKWTIIKRIIGLFFIGIGFVSFKVIGLLWGMVIGSYVIYIINSFLTSKYVGYNLKNQLSDLFPIISISSIAGLITYFVSMIEIHWLFSFLLMIVVYCLMYLFLSITLKIDAFSSFKSTVLILKHKI